jgi:hypothetical protein
MNPNGIWNEIQEEGLSPKEVYLRYLVFLAALPAIATYLGMVTIGMNIPLTNATFRWPVVGGLVTTVVSLAMSLVTVAVAAKVIELLGPKFKASPSFGDTVRLVAFAMTPSYIGGILGIIPVLSMLGLLFSLYALYVFYQGFQPMTGVASERKISYFIVSLIVSFVAMFVISFVTYSISPTSMNAGTAGSWSTEGSSDNSPAGKIELPGGISFDPQKFEESVKNFEKMIPPEARGN